MGKDQSNTRLPLGVSVMLSKCTELIPQGGSGAVELRAGAVCCPQSLLSEIAVSQVGAAVPAAGQSLRGNSFLKIFGTQSNLERKSNQHPSFAGGVKQ